MTAPTSDAGEAARWQHAETLFAEDRLDEAVEAYRSFHDSEALVVPAALRLSQVAMRQGRLRDAVACALAAYQLRSPEPRLLCGVARTLAPLGELRAMFACAHDFSVMRGRDAAAMLDLGTLLLASGFPADAVQMLDRARSAGAQGPQLVLPMARALQALGRTAEARNAYGACIEGSPGLIGAWLGLAEIGSRTPEGDVAMTRLLRELLAAGGDDAAANPKLHYALFELLDRGGDAGEAWAALEQGMRLQRAALSGYEPAADQALFDHLATLRGGDAAAPDDSAAADGGPTPVFLVGMHAPAIAAFGALLARHPLVDDLGEARDFVRQLRWCADTVGEPSLDLQLAQRTEGLNTAELGQRYLAATAWRAPAQQVLLDRNPANFANVAYIARALPNARILHLAAAPMDTCFAAMSAWTDPDAPWSHDQAETADTYRGYRRLMAHWRSEFPGRVLDVRHDELLSDPAAVLADVLRFCGLDAAAAPALAEGAGALLGEGRAAPQRWRRYEEPLAPLRAGLGALAY